MKTIDEYEEHYKDFSRPLMYVEVGEKGVPDEELKRKRVQDEELAYTFLTIEMSMGNEASYCKFTVISRDTACTEENKLSITPILSERFKLGNKVNVYLGYVTDDAAELVFSGYVTSIDFEYTGREDVSYTIEAMDLKIFMMSNYRSKRKKDMKKYSDVVTDILKDYRSLYTSQKIDATNDITSPIEQYNQSDYDFIVSLARKVDYMFFVCKGVVNFIDYTKLNDSIIGISPNAYLYSLEREVSISKQLKAVTVRTNDENDPDTPIEGKAVSVTTVGKGSQSGSDVIKLISDEMEKTIIDNSVKSEAEAKARAQAELNRSAMDFVSGECELIGIPALEPGKFITIQDIDKSIDGDYLITGIKHVFDDEGYKTICKFGANKI